MLALAASRLPGQPIPAGGLHGPGQESIARGQELPARRDLDISVLGIPLSILGGVHVEVFGHQGLRISRRLRIAHP